MSTAPGPAATLALHDIPEPKPGDDEVVVRVAACGVNFPDCLIIEDKYQYKPERPFAPGAEIAGTITAVGSQVTGLAPGDRVMAMIDWGGMAQAVAVPANRCVAMPVTMPFDEGASFIMTYGTAWHALAQRAVVRPGETILILGAAGGVGLAAVEIGKALGARVVVAASTQEKVDFAIASGADTGVVLPRGEGDERAIAARLKAACGGGAEIVVDPVGGVVGEAAVRALNWGGRLLIVGFPAGIPKLAANMLMIKGASAIGVFYGHFRDLEPQTDAENLAALKALYEDGRVRPQVTRRFPLSQGGDAIELIGQGHAMGKVVVEIG